MIWFDLDNSPHVPLFRPILEELKKRRVDYIVTARDFAQTKELLELWGIPHSMVGKHGVSRTRLEPKGVVTVAGERWDATTDADEAIEAQTPVVVVSVSGLRLKVRPEAPVIAPPIAGPLAT